MRTLAAIAAVITILLLLAPLAVRAADDSNSQNLASSPTVSPQQLSSSLNSLAQGFNDTNFQQQLSQFNAQLSSGNLNGAASTLVQLQADAQANPNTPASLNALLQSLNIGSNGASIDPNLLSSLLGLSNTNPYGVSGKLANESPTKVSVDLATLANLLQGTDPSLASQLLRQASQAGLTTAPLGFGAIRPPQISAPLISSAAQNGLPGLDAQSLLFPFVIIAAVAAVYLSRNRVRTLVGKQVVPGAAEPVDDGSYGDLDPSNPRHRIMLAFGRTVRIMRTKGVSKLRSETHREFSSKCEGSPSASYVSKISQQYERAKFSTLPVFPSDADDVQKEVETLESSP